jgi:hypothetical protein
LNGVACSSAEGFLQSLKFHDETEQRRVCSLVGGQAKRAGKAGQNWKLMQALYWKGEAYDRHGSAYQALLDRAYESMFRDSAEFRKALEASGDEKLEHSMGRSNPSETVLTKDEFCGRLERLRARCNER